MADKPEGPSVQPSIARIFVRPLGNPMPLGFFAYGMATVLLTAVELRWVRPQESLVLAILFLGYVAPLQLLACIFGFLSRDTGTATSMAILGATWIAMGVWYILGGVTAQTTAMGIFLLMDVLAVASVAAVSLFTKPLLAVLLFLAAVRFLLSALIQFGMAAALRLPAATLGLTTGAFAVYGGLALLFEDTRQRAVLPMFRRGAAREVIEGTLPEELRHLEREAGVRRQL